MFVSINGEEIEEAEIYPYETFVSVKFPKNFLFEEIKMIGEKPIIVTENDFYLCNGLFFIKEEKGQLVAVWRITK